MRWYALVVATAQVALLPPSAVAGASGARVDSTSLPWHATSDSKAPSAKRLISLAGAILVPDLARLPPRRSKTPSCHHYDSRDVVRSGRDATARCRGRRSGTDRAFRSEFASAGSARRTVTPFESTTLRSSARESVGLSSAISSVSLQHEPSRYTFPPDARFCGCRGARTSASERPSARCCA